MQAEATEVFVPLLNPNEPEATIVSLAVADGDEVAIGDVLGEIETTKSTEEVTSPAAGFVVGLTARPLDVVQAGDRLCWLSSDRDWTPPATQTAETPEPPGRPSHHRACVRAGPLARRRP